MTRAGALLLLAATALGGTEDGLAALKENGA